MMNYRLIGIKSSKKNKVRVLFLISSLILVFLILNFESMITSTNTINEKEENPRASAYWGWINLTNYMVNGTRHYHDDLVKIQGRLFYLPTNLSYIGYSVSLKVDGIILPIYTDTTNNFGEFEFDYRIPYSSNIYTDHIFEAVVNNPGGDVYYLNFFIINSKSYSTFANLLYNTSMPLLSEEDFTINGDLRYINGSNIPIARIDYTCLDGIVKISEGFFYTDNSGSFDVSIEVPVTASNPMTLKLNFSDNPYVDYSETYIYNIPIFSNITWNLNIDYTTTEGEEYELTGQLFSSTDPSLEIGNREILIFYNGTIVDTTPETIKTASDGTFEASFLIPPQNGTASIQVQLVDLLGKNLTSPIQYIVVDPAPESLPGGGGFPPFLAFSLIFFPILAGVIVGLGVYGYFYYRKQEEESRVVNLPLESRIKNLKILKDSGRLEESISYLFNAIYMDLINAKYNRIRKENETIRDFAIVSVKELKLTPTSIYPFIQKVEEIIYARPFKITEQDFYNTCGLFSPIYFQLTGYNFVLNF